MELIDTICHLDMPEFSKDLQAVLADARKHRVSHFILAGVTSADWPRMTALADAETDIHSAYGVHPQYLVNPVDDELNLLHAYLEKHPAVAVGEIGLDYFEKTANKPLQQQLFKGQLGIALYSGIF